MKTLNVLIGCEESQIVMKAFRKLGHNAKSCDIKECSGGEPEHHLQIDIFEALDLQKWDIVILHPPCTALAVSGNRWYGLGKEKYQERIKAVEWTQRLWDKAISVCNHVAMENPVGVLNRIGNFPKPQYIQPWQFGHGETKKTGLWLYGLNPLISTNIVNGREQRIWKMPPSLDRSVIRSKTYQGIADAMAEQWSKQVIFE
jgi:hypothetical protein